MSLDVMSAEAQGAPSPPFSAERGPGHVFATWARHKSSAGKVGPRNSLSQRDEQRKSLEISGTIGTLGNVYRKLLQMLDLDYKSMMILVNGLVSV